MNSTLAIPNGSYKNAFRAHRLVVLPDFQGLGIGTKINDFFGEYYLSIGRKYYMRTTHTRLKRNMSKNLAWRETSSSNKKHTNANVNNASTKNKHYVYDDTRIASSFEYVGQDYYAKEHKILIVDDNECPSIEYLRQLKDQYYLTVVTGRHKSENECEKICKELGIRTELLYITSKGVERKIDKYEKAQIYEKPIVSNNKKMNLYIYDIEVFSDDWIVIFRRPEEGSDYIVIHNDNSKLREFLSQPDIIIGGFNNKHYDNWILKTILNGGSNHHVKKHNDFIIGGGNAWDFEFVSLGSDIRYYKLPCPTFDLRDDIADPGISLKAIEGNLKLPIVESSIPFDIDRKLTPEELEEVIRYCKYDVDSTIKLYQERKENYIDAKALISEMYNLPVEEGIGLTNAKLCARILGAKPQKFNDERDYVIPDNIDTNLIPKIILDFFLQIRDKSIPDAKLFGAGKGSKGMTLDLILKTSYGECPVTYAWGGVHGAKPCVIVEETEDRVIINQDVASLYPNSMLNFGYCSRAMEDPEAYRKLVERRLGYKHSGDKLRSNALKLPINTTYGAMLNAYNDLADRWAGRSVCISNQLAMTMLITMLCQKCATIDFININTDGIMFSIDKKEVALSEEIVKEWSEITRFEMERDDFKKVIQKDVNNYIGITPDGSFKTKGGYVSLYKGGNFKTNSLSIVHKAIVDNLVNGIPAETTIKECKDIFAFQQIVKTGGTYEGSYHYVNGVREPIQKVNRIYAVKDNKYGQVVKGKWITEKRKKNKDTGKMESTPVDPPVWSETVISECPEHCFIDNENVLTVDDLDLDYYIDMAKKRIDKYINIDPTVARKIAKIKEEVVIMATKTETKTDVTLNVYAKLLEARKRFLEAGIKKTGVNRYAEYKYFTLDDIIPQKQAIFKDLGLSDVISFGTEVATLTIFNVDNPEESIEFMSQLDRDESLIKNPIQKVGAIQTYVRRYLYLLALDIIESDGIEETTDKPVDENGEPAPVATAKKSNRPATPAERQETKGELIDKDGNATDTQIKSIKRGLKKLREKNDSYEPYIAETLKKIKKGMTKTEAEDQLIEIGKKIEE